MCTKAASNLNLDKTFVCALKVCVRDATARSGKPTYASKTESSSETERKEKGNCAISDMRISTPSFCVRKCRVSEREREGKAKRKKEKTLKLGSFSFFSPPPPPLPRLCMERFFSSIRGKAGRKGGNTAARRKKRKKQKGQRRRLCVPPPSFPHFPPFFSSAQPEVNLFPPLPLFLCFLLLSSVPPRLLPYSHLIRENLLPPALPRPQAAVGVARNKNHPCKVSKFCP